MSLNPLASPAPQSGAPTGTNSSAKQGPLGAFAAILDAIDTEETGGKLSASSQSELKLAIENLLGAKVVGFDVTAGSQIGVQLAGSAGLLSLAEIATAAGLDVEALGETQTSPDALFAGLLDLLAQLGKTLEAGEKPDEATLTELSETLDALAAALDLPLPAKPNAELLAGLSARQSAEGASLLDQLKGALADLSKGLSDPQTQSGTSAAVGAKLGAFLTALAETENGDAVMAKLGLAPGKGEAVDPALQASITALLAGKAISKDAVQPPSTDPRLTETIASGELSKSEDGKDPEATVRLSEVGRPGTRDAQQDTKSLVQLAGMAEARTETADATTTAAALQSGTRVDIAPGPKPVMPGYQTSQQQINLPQIAFEVVRQVQQGNSQFQIRLDPPDLGRIDVRMDIDKAGNVTARLTVEKAETLDLMQRDQRALERALVQAGLDGSKTNLEFSLKQNPFAQQDQNQQGHGRNPVFGDEAAAEIEEASPPTINLYRGALSASGVNIFV